MKHVIIIGALCCTHLVQAQITLTSASNFTAGSTVEVGVTTQNLAPNVVQGNVGPAQTWNFVTTAHDYFDTTNFVNAAAVPAMYTSPFPQSTIASYKDSDTTRYGLWHADAGGVYADGSSRFDPQFGILYQHNQNPMKFM